MNNDRTKIHIDITNQDTTAKLRCEGIGVSDYVVAILYDIQDIKPFRLFSKVRFCGKEEWFYCDYVRKMLISRDTKPIDYWLNINKESEDKPMQHNVTITKEENRVIEEYWCIRAIRACDLKKTVIDEKELDHNPTLQEIAQFLSETKADFVSVEHNYRFADLQGC